MAKAGSTSRFFGWRAKLQGPAREEELFSHLRGCRRHWGEDIFFFGRTFIQQIVGVRSRYSRCRKNRAQRIGGGFLKQVYDEHGRSISANGHGTSIAKRTPRSRPPQVLWIAPASPKGAPWTNKVE